MTEPPSSPRSALVSSSFSLPTDVGPGQVELTEPARGEPVGLLVLGPGASGKTETKDLSAVRDAAAEEGWAVALVTPPYAVAGRKVPPRGEAPDIAFTQVVAQLRERLEAQGSAGWQRATEARGPAGAQGPAGTRTAVVTGGRSFGSRVACRTAAATGSVAVVCLAFPVHPPGRPEKSRLGELDPVAVPVLVVQGERDPFGRPEPVPGREVVLVAGDHALSRDLPAVVAAVRGFLTRFARPATLPGHGHA